MIAFEIERLREISRIGKAEFAEQIKMTRQGYDNALKNDNFKTNTLRIAAQILGVDISHFFTNNNDNQSNKNFLNNSIVANDGSSVREAAVNYQTQRDMEKENLTERITSLEEQIALLTEMKDHFKNTATDLRDRNEALFVENQDLKKEIKELKAQIK